MLGQRRTFAYLCGLLTLTCGALGCALESSPLPSTWPTESEDLPVRTPADPPESPEPPPLPAPGADASRPSEPPSDARVREPKDSEASDVDAGQSTLDAAPQRDADGPLEQDAGPTQGDAAVEPTRCGTRGGMTCGKGEFCAFAPESGCGMRDQGGECRPRPTACDAVYEPVCSCDGVTYGNSCIAQLSGASIASRGMCAPPVSSRCGGISGMACGPNEYCSHEPALGGDSCIAVADSSGVCLPRPVCVGTLVPVGGIVPPLAFNPVCGCDARTYPSLCDALAAGVAVSHLGMCSERECKEAGGHAVDGAGPAGRCPKNEIDYGPIRREGGEVALEGTICCRK